jgi:hypothetical protein
MKTPPANQSECRDGGNPESLATCLPSARKGDLVLVGRFRRLDADGGGRDDRAPEEWCSQKERKTLRIRLISANLIFIYERRSVHGGSDSNAQLRAFPARSYRVHDGMD